MEEPLRRRPICVRAEDYIPRPGLCACQRMDGNKEGILNPIELDRAPERRRNHLGMPQYFRSMAANCRGLVEHPDFRSLDSLGLANQERGRHRPEGKYISCQN